MTKITRPEAAHHCPDWDFLFIRPGDPEMECCLCGTPEQHSEATRRAALYDHERAREDAENGKQS